MFGLIKKKFIRTFTDLVNASNHKKCVSLSNQKCEIQATLINLHTNEYIPQRITLLSYYLFAV